MANARRAASTSHVWGCVLVLAAGGAFISTMYMMVFSKLLRLLDGEPAAPLAPWEDVKQGEEAAGLLDALERDVYYSYLLPLTIPVTILAFYANWVSLKFFRHN